MRKGNLGVKASAPIMNEPKGIEARNLNDNELFNADVEGMGHKLNGLDENSYVSKSRGINIHQFKRLEAKEIYQELDNTSTCYKRASKSKKTNREVPSLSSNIYRVEDKQASHKLLAKRNTSRSHTSNQIDRNINQKRSINRDKKPSGSSGIFVHRKVTKRNVSDTDGDATDEDESSVGNSSVSSLRSHHDDDQVMSQSC